MLECPDSRRIGVGFGVMDVRLRIAAPAAPTVVVAVTGEVDTHYAPVFAADDKVGIGRTAELPHTRSISHLGDSVLGVDGH
jgi:hypothetical protein